MRTLSGRRGGFAVLVLIVSAIAGCGGGGGGGGGGGNNSPKDMGGQGGTGGDVDAGGSGGGGSADMGGSGGGGAGGSMADMGPPDAAECNCPAPQTCDPSTHACVDGQCTGDGDCLMGRICTDGMCGPGCADDAACVAADPSKPVCTPRGRCGECSEQSPCPGRQTCDMATATCQEAAGGACDGSTDCKGGRVCVDGTCADPYDCNATPCPGGQTCLASGECVPVEGACNGDDQCAIGERCLGQGAQARCGHCRTDDDCVPGQTCLVTAAGNRCTEPATCDADDQCVGARVCDTGECAAPVCHEDALEPDDTLDAPAMIQGDRAYRGLMSCNDDWYRFTVPAGTFVTVVVRQDDGGADLELHLYDDRNREVGSSQTGRLAETVVAGPFASDRDLTLGVLQAGPPSVVGYSLEVGFTPQDQTCADDARDVGAGDDGRESATILRRPGEPPLGAEVTGRICPGDEDWYCFDVQANERVKVSGAVTSGSAVITVDVLGQDDMPLSNMATGTWRRGQDDNQIPPQRGRPGLNCVRVRNADRNTEPGGYRLSIKSVPQALEQLCQMATALQLQNGSGSARGTLPTGQDVDLMRPTCAGGADGGEAVYTVHVPANQLLVARASGLGGGTLGDPVVSIRRDCESQASEAACGDDQADPDAPFLVRSNPAEARLPVEVEGDYSIIVDGVAAGDHPEFLLEAETRPLAVAPRNDGCAAAEDIQLLNGAAEVQANLDRAADDLSGPCLPAGGPDAVYHLHLEQAGRVTVQVRGVPTDFPVGAYLVRACGDASSTVACGVGFDLTSVDAGDYFLVLEGLGPNARGRVVAQVAVESQGEPPANDVCGSARALDPAGGILDGDTRAAHDDYRLPAANNCTGANSFGGDVAYSLPVHAGQAVAIQATPENGWDLSLYVLRDCNGPNLAGACLVGHDGALAERVMFTPAADGNVFVVVDGSSSEAGAFRLEWGAPHCAADGDCGPGLTCGQGFCVDE